MNIRPMTDVGKRSAATGSSKCDIIHVWDNYFQMRLDFLRSWLCDKKGSIWMNCRRKERRAWSQGVEVL